MNGVTTNHAQCFGLDPQAEGESDSAFRHRIAGKLRDMGHIIEAHEAQQDRRYDDLDQSGTGSVLDGVYGAMAQALQGNPYRARDGVDQVGLDIAAGVVSRAPKPDPAAMLMMLGMMEAGRDRLHRKGPGDGF